MSNFDEEECLNKWETFSKKKKGEGVGLGWLINQAKPYGFTVKSCASRGKKEDFPTWTEAIQQTLDAVENDDENLEMGLRGYLKSSFYARDEKIDLALWKAFADKRVKKVKPKYSSIQMSKVQSLEYLQDGWIIKGDVQLIFGAAGTGKTTTCLKQSLSFAKGEGFLDRSATCKPGKTLFIATDSGLSPLLSAFEQLGIDKDDPLINPGPNQKIFVWGHDPSQGHGSWMCDIRGMMKLEQFIKQENIDFIVIDSAKSVASMAGWNYMDNADVKLMLTCFREGICNSTGVCVQFISHDGTQEGSAAGAKAWKEEPSMVIGLTKPLNPDGSEVGSVKATFLKNRAETVDEGKRTVEFALNRDQEDLVLTEGQTVVGNCEGAVLDVLLEQHQKGRPQLPARVLINECAIKHHKTEKTVRNTLSALCKGKAPKVTKPRHGFYALAPSALKSLSYKGVHKKSGYNTTKSIGMTEKTQYPDEYPDQSVGTLSGTSDQDTPPSSNHQPNIPITPLETPSGYSSGYCKNQSQTGICPPNIPKKQAPLLDPPSAPQPDQGRDSKLDPFEAANPPRRVLSMEELFGLPVSKNT